MAFSTQYTVAKLIRWYQVGVCSPAAETRASNHRRLQPVAVPACSSYNLFHHVGRLRLLLPAPHSSVSVYAVVVPYAYTDSAQHAHRPFTWIDQCMVQCLLTTRASARVATLLTSSRCLGCMCMPSQYSFRVLQMVLQFRLPPPPNSLHVPRQSSKHAASNGLLVSRTCPIPL